MRAIEGFIVSMLLIAAGLPGCVFAYFVCYYNIWNLCATLSEYGMHQVLVWLIIGSPIFLIGIHLWERYIMYPSIKYDYSSIGPTIIYNNGFHDLTKQFINYKDIDTITAYTIRVGYLVICLEFGLVNGKIITIEDKKDGWRDLLTQLNQRLTLREDIFITIKRLVNEHPYFGKQGKRIMVFKR